MPLICEILTDVGEEILRISRQIHVFEHDLLTECFADGQQPSSYQARRFCKMDLIMQVCQSGAGYYLGSLAPDDDDMPGTPVGRDSVEYYSTVEAATDALDNFRWTQRLDA